MAHAHRQRWYRQAAHLSCSGPSSSRGCASSGARHCKLHPQSRQSWVHIRAWDGPEMQSVRMRNQAGTWAQDASRNGSRHARMNCWWICGQFQQLTVKFVFKTATTLQDKIFTGFKIEIKCKDCYVQWKITIFSQEALDEPNSKKRTKFFSHK